jgi:periplasmic divalent cation tolerance protein
MSSHSQSFSPGRFGVVLVTAASQSEAEAIAKTLVESRLAACINLMPIQSIYTWQGKIHQDAEWQLVIKTDLSNFSLLEKKIKELHSYEIPEIIALPILAGSQPYLHWISEQTH